MSPLGRQCSSLAFLLALLWTVGPSGAGQPQSPVDTALDPQQVLREIVQEVKTELEPLINQIVSRIDGLNSHLASVDSHLTTVDSRLSGVDSRLSGVESRLSGRLSGIESRLNVLDFKQDAFDASLDDHSSRIESAEAKLGPGLVPLTSRLNSTRVRLDQLTSQVNTTEDRLGSTVEELVSQVNGTSAGLSDRLDRISSHLSELSARLDDLANLTDTFRPRPRDCSELPAGARSGIYLLQPGLQPSQPPVSAYCDLETDGGGWTVIQRRKNIQPRQDFNRGWTEYREGFGDLQGEFWWGLQSMWKLTGSGRQYQLRVNLADFDGGSRYATYSRFRVGPEADGYRLTVSGYSGTAGDSLDYSNGKKFSTKDRDQDGSNGSCAQSYKGGWWFYGCYRSFLNGPYLYGERAEWEGINWYHWRGKQYSLSGAEMKIRPV